MSDSYAMEIRCISCRRLIDSLPGRRIKESWNAASWYPDPYSESPRAWRHSLRAKKQAGRLYINTPWRGHAGSQRHQKSSKTCIFLKIVNRRQDTGIACKTASFGRIYSTPCLQFQCRKTFRSPFQKRDLKKWPEDRNRIRTRRHTLPILFKIIITLIINILFVLLLYKVNLKPCFRPLLLINWNQ